MNELYSYDKYKGFHIFIECENHKYYASIQGSGSTVKSLGSTNPDKLMEMCKSWIDYSIDMDGES